jgi:hypothetical protein
VSVIDGDMEEHAAFVFVAALFVQLVVESQPCFNLWAALERRWFKPTSVQHLRLASDEHGSVCGQRPPPAQAGAKAPGQGSLHQRPVTLRPPRLPDRKYCLRPYAPLPDVGSVGAFSTAIKLEELNNATASSHG